MKYTIETVIDAPLEDFISKMDNPDYMKHWQRGLVSHEFTSGIPGEKGSKMVMNYDHKGRKFSLEETIIDRSLPNKFDATYVMPGMYNLQRNIFESTSDGKTKWISNCEFTSDKFMYRIMMFLMPGLFKKQSILLINDLKAFVEDGTSVLDQ